MDRKINTHSQDKGMKISIGKYTEKLELLYVTSENVKQFRLCGKDFDSSSRTYTKDDL